MTADEQRSAHRYPAGQLRGDFVRAAAGTVVCSFPFLVVPVHTIAAFILGGLTLLFATYGIRTWLRRLDTIVIDDTGLSAGVLYRRTLPWQAMNQLKLRYFSTRRDRTAGWMQLVLRCKGKKLAIDSELEGFDDLCRRACDVARANGVTLNESTVRNLMALGLDATDMAPDSDVIVRSGTDRSGKKGSWGDPAEWRR